MAHLAFLICLIHSLSLNITKILSLECIQGLNDFPELSMLYMKQNETNNNRASVYPNRVCDPVF